MSKWTAKNCVVVGATGGIGSAFVEHLILRDNIERVFATSRSGRLPVSHETLTTLPLDYENPSTIAAAVGQIDVPLDIIIVATGLLHDGDFGPEKSLRDLDAERLARAYQVNAIGPALVAQYFLPLLRKDTKTVFAALSARVGSISDNKIGGWYGYRAAKAGLNQLLRTLSIEHSRRWRDSVVIGLHPGTVDTGLSKPFQRQVPDGKLFTPNYSAGSMLNVIDRVTAVDTGKVFAYDGSEVPA